MKNVSESKTPLSSYIGKRFSIFSWQSNVSFYDSRSQTVIFSSSSFAFPSTLKVSCSAWIIEYFIDNHPFLNWVSISACDLGHTWETFHISIFDILSNLMEFFFDIKKFNRFWERAKKCCTFFMCYNKFNWPLSCVSWKIKIYVLKYCYWVLSLLLFFRNPFHLPFSFSTSAFLCNQSIDLISFYPLDEMDYQLFEWWNLWQFNGWASDKDEKGKWFCLCKSWEEFKFIWVLFNFPGFSSFSKLYKLLS